VHIADDTLGHLLALHLTPADKQDRSQLKRTAKAVQKATGQSVGIAYVDQGYTGDQARDDAEDDTADCGIMLHVVKLFEAKRGFVLLPRRWVVERSFAWMTRFSRLAKDFERLPKTAAGLHFAVFACIMLARCFATSA
jgi:transposase